MKRKDDTRYVLTDMLYALCDTSLMDEAVIIGTNKRISQMPDRKTFKNKKKLVVKKS